MKLFDLHCDTILRLYGEGGQLSENNYHIDLSKMKEGDSLAQFFAMFVDLDKTKTPFKTCNEMIDVFEQEIDKNRNIINQGFGVKDIKEDKITGIITIEEGGVLEGKLENLDHFYDRGVRSITLTWNYENEIGYPNCKAPFVDKGLKPFGLEVVKRMNDLGMLVDVSHLSDGGFWDCIKHSEYPIIASHSNARALCDVSRNLTDEMILALKDNGGVMGMNFCSYFLDKSKVSKVDDIVKHIKYIDDLAGIDVIAIGTDFDGIGGELEIADMSMMRKLVDALKTEGYNDEQLEKVFYKNALRVMSQVK